MLERGYSARDAQIIETGPDGRARFTLQAALIEQQPATRDIVLTDIDMRLQSADASKAVAPGAVFIVLQNHRLEGTGLEADLKTYQARIRADVHGRFTP